MAGGPLSPEMCARIRRLSEQHSHKAIARITGVAESTISELRRRNWQTATLGRARPPMPGDLAIQANYMTVDQMLRHYRVGRDTMRAWLKTIDRIYVPKRESKRKRPAPSREELVAALEAHGGVMGACAHYRCTRETFRRWRREQGLPIAPPLSGPGRRSAAHANSNFGWADRYRAGAGA